MKLRKKCLDTERSDTCVHFVDMLALNVFFFFLATTSEKGVKSRELNADDYYCGRRRIALHVCCALLKENVVLTVCVAVCVKLLSYEHQLR